MNKNLFALILCAAIFAPGTRAKAVENKFEQKCQCHIAGELYYSNYLQEQAHNPLFSFETFYIQHEVAYSPKLNTCVLYVGIKRKLDGGRVGHNWNKFIMDILNNKTLYFMSYGADESGNEIVIQRPSSFKTDAEFVTKKEEIFNQ